MDAPICEYVKRYAEKEPLRLHMPGHKGISFLGMESMDITEITGADVLYHAEGIIRKSEENAASLFGTGMTFYSAEGASLVIRGMLYLTALYARRNGKKPRILAARNAHKVFITASALLNIDVQWMYPQNGSDLVACRISASELEAHLDESDEMPTAVYITSPDYLGNIADVKRLSEVCHQRGVLLLVDNAHGAYLNFLPESLHPIALGADLCCDSAHKTLPVLTGGAYLHISRHAESFFVESAERALAMFATTSPSYLILQSLDMANVYLASGYREKLKRAIALWDGVREDLRNAGYCVIGDEPLKLTLLPKSYGYTGTELAEILEKQNMFCEFFDQDHLVMMVSPEWGTPEAERVKSTLLAVPQKEPIRIIAPGIPVCRQVVSPNEAIYLDSVEIDASESEGRIMASASVSCPPAIPIVSLGQRISRAAVDAMAYYGITTISVIKD